MAVPHLVVTGAAGFIGAHLVRRLRADGHRVVGIDGLRGTTTAATAAVRLGDLEGDQGFELVEADLLGLDLQGVLTGAGAVFHLAARPGVRGGDREALTRDNVQATDAVVTAAEACGTVIVLASSSAVYGDGATAGPCREDGAVSPLSHYGATKRSAELCCLQARVRAVVVRLFSVYGPHQRSDMAFARFIAAARDGHPAPLLQDLSATRDYTYVDDAVTGLVLAWEQGTAPVYNVSGGQVVDLQAARELIEELTGGSVRTKERPAARQPVATHADLALARADLGYSPTVDLREGLRRQLGIEGAPA